MSEYLTDGKKQDALKAVIQKLHAGAGVDEVKKEFHSLIRNVSPDEIALMEQSLIDEGFPVEEIQRLCDVHVEVFNNSLLKQKRAGSLPGHPVHTFRLENKEAKSRIKTLKKLLKRFKKSDDEEVLLEMRAAFEDFKRIDLHYLRKENQLFPYLEEKEFTGPSRVMWGKHNEIRALLKSAQNAVNSGETAKMEKEFAALFPMVNSMIFMEEKILFPTSMKKLVDREWALIRRGEKEIGYAWVRPGNLWDSGIVLQKSMEESLKTTGKVPVSSGINLDVGSLTPEQLNLMLKALPVDITFVDENDSVCYYTGSTERVFPRSPAIIGRSVKNCHPQKSVHIVEEILKSFKERKREKAEFWISLGEVFAHIRYFPLYGPKGEYKGCIEVTQDVAAIRSLKGEKRLLDW